jgi:Flp pilus assembly protein TadG
LLAIPLVLFLFFGIFELGRHYYTRLTLQDAVAQAARFAVTGRSLDDPDNPDAQLTRAESIEHVITGQLLSPLKNIVITTAMKNEPAF